MGMEGEQDDGDDDNLLRHKLKDAMKDIVKRGIGYSLAFIPISLAVILLGAAHWAPGRTTRKQVLWTSCWRRSSRARMTWRKKPRWIKYGRRVRAWRKRGSGRSTPTASSICGPPHLTTRW